MEFGVLGPVSVRDGEREIRLSGRLRRLLAALLCERGSAVHPSTLVETIWGDQPPRDVRNTLQVNVHRLRTALGSAQRIAHGPAGYTLHVERGEVDADRFADLAADGRRALVAGDLDAASALLGRALRLWRGAPFADLADLEVARNEAARLEEQRLIVVEERIAADLRRGSTAEVVPELRALIRRHPYRERARGYLMIALHRTGRQAEALKLYRATHSGFIAELGIEPGSELRALHEAMLREEPLPRFADVPAESETAAVAADAAVVPVPRQLPAASTCFAGRSDVLAELAALLARPVPPSTMVISAIDGVAGIGKTALALHVAHSRTHEFTDGQLHVNLRGFDPVHPPVEPVEALGQFLRALGVPAERVPSGVDEQAALYRSLLAGRRVLILLDNAVSAEQVRPLLPGTSTCLVLVTSRNRLTGLVVRDGAHHVALDPLSEQEALWLITELLGEDRVGSRAEAAELVRLCGRLPLALRIVAGDLAVHPGRAVGDVVAELREGDRLGALEVEGDAESTVRAAFALSYAALDEPVREAFRHIGVHPGPVVTPVALAALLNRTENAADELLRRLVETNLVEEERPERFRPHDLVRVYATECAEREMTAVQREDALNRLLTVYSHTALLAGELLFPRVGPSLEGRSEAVLRIEPRSEEEALLWFETERANLVSAVLHAAEHGPLPEACRLADALRGFFMVRKHLPDWLAVGRAALAAAERLGDRHARAAMHASLALAHWTRVEYRLAIEHFEQAHEHYSHAGLRHGEGGVMTNLGGIHWELGQLELAEKAYVVARAAFEEIGSRDGIATVVGNLGLIRQDRGDLDEALELFRTALATSEELGSLYGMAIYQVNLGRLHRDRGELRESTLALHRALDLYERNGARDVEGYARNELGRVALDDGRVEEAGEAARRALLVAEQIGETRLEVDATSLLGDVHRATGDTARAAEHHGRALAVAREAGYVRGELEGMLGLAHDELAAGRAETALEHARAAAGVAARAGFELFVVSARRAEETIRGSGGTSS